MKSEAPPSPFRSIRWRLALVYLLLVLFAMQVVSFYVFRSLERYYRSSFSQALNSHAALFSGFAQRYLATGPDRMVLSTLVSEFARQSGYLVGVFDSSGEMIASASPAQVGGDSAGSGATLALGAVFDPGQVARSASGAKVEAIRVQPGSGERQLHVSVPVPGADGKTAGAVYLVGSLEATYRMMSDVRAIIMAATILAVALTVALAYALAKTITGPIEAVTRGAAKMAEGQFRQEIPVRSDDEVGRLAAMFNFLAGRLRDTISQVTAEREKLSAILTHMTDGIVAIDGAGEVILINPAACRILGVKVRGRIGKPYGELLGQLGIEDSVIETLSGARGISREIWSPAGKTVRVEFAPLRGQHGAPAGAFLLLRDVTEEARLEAMRRDFVANVSHELRTPLTAVKSYVETLLSFPDEDRGVVERFLSVVDKEADRMARLVNDLLYLSRLDQEPSSLMKRETVCLYDLAQDALAKMSVHAENKGVDLELAGDRRVFVKGESDRLAQVILNLLSNAIDFTPSGGKVSVGLRLEPSDAGELFAALEVRDTGAGIPPEDLPHVFERFYRVEKARSREQGGSGLGLPIAKQIVLSHGGEIDIKSKPGEGTAVTVVLPAYEE